MKKQQKKIQNKCDWYMDGCCCRDLDAGRVWDCVISRNIKDVLRYGSNKQKDCKYFKKI